MRDLRTIASEVVDAWNAWCEPEGWRKTTYDRLSNAINELEIWLLNDSKNQKAGEQARIELGDRQGGVQ